MSETIPTAEKKPLVGKELKVIITKACEGDKSVLPQIREIFTDPAKVEAVGNIITKAQSAIMERFIGKDILQREAIILKMESLRGALNGTNANPLEELLVERVLSCWLHLHLLEWAFAQKEEISIKRADYYEQMIDRAQKRYLAAIKTLANVRRLALPVLIGQLNVAEQQVNVSKQPSEQA